jgi:hypothetical protein
MLSRVIFAPTKIAVIGAVQLACVETTASAMSLLRFNVLIFAVRKFAVFSHLAK